MIPRPIHLWTWLKLTLSLLTVWGKWVYYSQRRNSPIYINTEDEGGEDTYHYAMQQDNYSFPHPTQSYCSLLSIPDVRGHTSIFKVNSWVIESRAMFFDWRRIHWWVGIHLLVMRKGTRNSKGSHALMSHALLNYLFGIKREGISQRACCTYLNFIYKLGRNL